MTTYQNQYLGRVKFVRALLELAVPSPSLGVRTLEPAPFLVHRLAALLEARLVLSFLLGFPL